MRALPKFLIGLLAALAAGWVSHGPLGGGEAFIGQVEARAKTVVAEAGVSGVAVRLERNPLRRAAILSGPANDFQREGQGLFPGLNDRVRAVPGVSGLRWTDGYREGRRLPLLLELEMLVVLAYVAGLGLGRLLFRPRRKSFLE